MTATKSDIFVGLQYRDNLSVGQNRIQLGTRAFHWSIIVIADTEHHRFDVTDGLVQDPKTFEDTNPDRVWVYRHNVSDALSGIPRYLGSIQINSKQVNTTIASIEKILENVQIPDSDGDKAQNNCVTWTIKAIQALQQAGYSQNFDLDSFQEYALTHADGRMADFKNKADPVKYPSSSTRWLRLF